MYRQRHGDEAEEQVGDGQIDDKDVARRPHGRLAGDDKDDERVADCAQEDEDAVSGDQAEKSDVVDPTIGAETLDDRQIQFARNCAAAAAVVPGVFACCDGAKRQIEEKRKRILAFGC